MGIPFEPLTDGIPVNLKDRGELVEGKALSLSRTACARILVRQLGSVLWVSLRHSRSSSVKGATNLIAVLMAGIVPENFCFSTYSLRRTQ
jgi:hypothetical protein